MLRSETDAMRPSLQFTFDLFVKNVPYGRINGRKDRRTYLRTQRIIEMLSALLNASQTHIIIILMSIQRIKHDRLAKQYFMKIIYLILTFDTLTLTF